MKLSPNASPMSLRLLREIDLPDYRDIAILGPFKVPIEFPMILQVLPTVGRADVPARGLGESRLVPIAR